MNDSQYKTTRSSSIWWQYAVMLAIFSVPAMIALGVASFFTLTKDTAVLRDSLMATAQGGCDQRIALNVGSFTLGLVRAGVSFCPMPPEASAALRTVRGGEVALCRLSDGIQSLNRSALIATADAAMAKRGMQRIVGVSTGNDLVVVYMPGDKMSPSRIRCSVMVLHEQEVVIAGMRGNLEPIMQIVSEQLKSIEAEHFPKAHPLLAKRL